jgi:hypothetical protein
MSLLSLKIVQSLNFFKKIQRFFNTCRADSANFTHRKIKTYYYLCMFQQMHLLYYNTNFSVNYYSI